MKVKCIKNDKANIIKYGKIYNVFSIEISKDNAEHQLYISNEDSIYTITPYSINDFEIIENNLPEIFTFGIDKQGDIIIGPEEIYSMDFFWWNLSEDNKNYMEIIDKYYKIAKNDLFNI